MPVQFLIQVVNPAACITPPAIIGVPDEQSCTPVIVGQTTVIELIAINSCGPNVTILDISTLAFAGITQGNITKRNATTYHKVYTWIPTTAQLGYQVMCAMAYDRYIYSQHNRKIQSILCRLVNMPNQHNTASSSMHHKA